MTRINATFFFEIYNIIKMILLHSGADVWRRAGLAPLISV